MGKQDIFKFLKSNPNSYFTVENLCNILDVNKQSLNASLKKLDGVDVKTVLGSKGTGHIVKTYGFVSRDEGLEECVKELELFRKVMPMVNSDVLVGLLNLKYQKMILKELKKCEGKKGECKKQV